MRAILNSAQLTKYLRNHLWAQCALMTTQLENIIINTVTNKSAAEMFYGQNPSWTKHLRIFGEIGIVHDGQHSKIKGKLTDRGILVCMFIGYSEDHTANVYKFLNLDKESINNPATPCEYHK